MPDVVNIVAAKSRVRIEAAPEWVHQTPFDPEYKATGNTPITYLLFDTQIEAELRQTYFRQSVRLETMEAVQHQSQWRLQFEPRDQRIALHSLKIRRGEREIDQLNLEKAHFLQREEGLEHFVIHGWCTLLMVLDDVRPGDTLEFSYTIETQSRLLPDHSGRFYSLPEGVSVGRYYFSAQFSTPRQMKWKSSSTDLKPTESQTNGTTRWAWSGENHTGRVPERNTPVAYISYPWIQISDFPDWQTIAAAISETWKMDNGSETIDAIAQEIEASESEQTARIEKAIRLVQDECRYLSVDLELGGHIPSPPEIVARRRFGDCKDLSFLLVNLLKKLGVKSRPILVNTLLRKLVGDLLPTPWLFNHVVVEYEAEGKRRWIDTTMKEQGGGAFNRVMPDYGLGLPVATECNGLAKSPNLPEQFNEYELHEHILLDTTGAPSLLAVNLRAEGEQAEILRLQFKRDGTEEIAKQRLEMISKRFANAKRIGSLQHRYDRESNQFFLVETFEVQIYFNIAPNGGTCCFQLPGSWIATVLEMPEKTPRRAPWALPHPCQVVYIFDADSPAIQFPKLNEPQCYHNSKYVRFSREDRAGHEYFVMKLSLNTIHDSIPTDQVEQHRALVEKIWEASNRILYVAQGYSRPREKPGFGELPSPQRKAEPLPQLPSVIPVEKQEITQEILPSPVPSSPEKRSHRVSSRQRHRQPTPDGQKIVLRIISVCFLLFWTIFLLAVWKNRR